jgi:uncharacterized membrane protein YcgQ (UPF0703/DUF1980 family)
MSKGNNDNKPNNDAVQQAPAQPKQATEEVYVVAMGCSFATSSKGTLVAGEVIKPQYFCTRNREDEEKVAAERKAASEAFELHKKKGMVVTKADYEKQLKLKEAATR